MNLPKWVTPNAEGYKALDVEHSGEDGDMPPVDEVLREIAKEEGIDLPDDATSTATFNGLLLREKFQEHKDKIREAKEKVARDKKREETRTFLLKVVLPAVILALGGGTYGGVELVRSGDVAEAQHQKAESETTTKATRERMSNKLQIDNLGVEMVKVQDAQVAMPDYIIDSIKAGKKVKKPDALKVLDKDKESKKQAAKKGKLLEVSDEALDAALKAAEEH